MRQLQREENWPDATRLLEAAFAVETRAEWTARFAGSDACTFPVLAIEEAMCDEHMVAREIYPTDGEVAPAPRLSRTPGGTGPQESGEAAWERWSAASKR